MENILLEAFQKLKLFEETFDLADIDKPDELKSYVADDVEVPVEEIIDVEADDEEELQNSYVGKVIIECPCCRSKFYKDKDTIIVDQEVNLANVDEACPVCTCTGGFNVIGKIEDATEKVEEACEKNEDCDKVEEDCKTSFLDRKKKNIEKLKDESEEDLTEDLVTSDDATIVEKSTSLPRRRDLRKGTHIDEEKSSHLPRRRDLNDSLDTSIGNDANLLRRRDLRKNNSVDESTLPRRRDLRKTATIKEERIPDPWGDKPYIEVPDEELKESVEIKAEGEDKIEVEKHDDGSMTVEVPAESKGETIAPLTDEEETEIEENKPGEEEEEKIEVETSEESESEEPEEEEVTDIDMKTFDELGESFMKKVYSNVNKFITTSVKNTDDGIIVEGLIDYKSGNSKETVFKFNSACSLKERLILEGTNSTFSNSKRPFTIRGKLVNGKLVCESLTYRYTVKSLNESTGKKTIRISGKVKLK